MSGNVEGFAVELGRDLVRIIVDFLVVTLKNASTASPTHTTVNLVLMIALLRQKSSCALHLNKRPPMIWIGWSHWFPYRVVTH